MGRLPPLEEWNAWVDFITWHINPMSGQAQLEVLEEPKAHPFSKQSQLQWAFNELWSSWSCAICFTCIHALQADALHFTSLGAYPGWFAKLCYFYCWKTIIVQLGRRWVSKTRCPLKLFRLWCESCDTFSCSLPPSWNLKLTCVRWHGLRQQREDVVSCGLLKYAHRLEEFTNRIHVTNS